MQYSLAKLQLFGVAEIYGTLRRTGRELQHAEYSVLLRTIDELREQVRGMTGQVQKSERG